MYKSVEDGVGKAIYGLVANSGHKVNAQWDNKQ